MYFHYYENFTRFHNKEKQNKTSFQFSYGNLYDNKMYGIQLYTVYKY